MKPMTGGITAVVMVGPPDDEPIAGWIAAARRAAAVDLVTQLTRQPLVNQILLLSPVPLSSSDHPSLTYVPTAPGAVHIGRLLAQLVATRSLERLLVLGGGSAPLLSDADLGQALVRLAEADSLLVTNNRHASDWAGVVPARRLLDAAERLPRDNMLGWVLSHEFGLPWEALPPATGSRLDIDTPADLIALRLHPGTRPALRECLKRLPLPTEKAEAILAVLARPAGRVILAGRVAPAAWEALNRVSGCWLRVVAEERGMVSSGRHERGEVYSLVGDLLEQLGPAPFFERLAQHADAALIDSRVLMAHAGCRPSAEDRFASDLGRVEVIADPWLRRLTAAARDAGLPVLLGGHGLLSGDLFAFCDILWYKSGRTGSR